MVTPGWKLGTPALVHVPKKNWLEKGRSRQWQFFKKNQRGTGTEVAEHFRRNKCTLQILKSFCHVQMFVIRKRFTWN